MPEPNILVSEEQILDAALRELRKRLPGGWTADAQHEGRGQLRGDAIITLAAPDGRKARLFAETKRSLVTKDLSAITSQLERFIDAALAEDPGSAAAPLVVARYLARPLQRWLEEKDISYADATGNLRVAIPEPGLFVRDVGALKDPWRGPGRPKGNLKGASAARIVRALVDFRPPYTVPALMKLAGTPSGNTYRAVEFIEDQDLLTREDGAIRSVRWRSLLERWSADYSFSTLADRNTYLAPRGLPDLMRRLAEVDENAAGRYAVTGSLATRKWESYAPAKNALIYAQWPERLADQVDLRRVDAGTNVVLARSGDTAAFDRAQRLDDTVIVAPSQAAVDLLTAPGRGPEEGRALLDWMEKNEPSWRQ